MTNIKNFKPLAAAIIAAAICAGTSASAATANFRAPPSGPLTFQAGAGQSVGLGDEELQTTFSGITNGTSFLNYQNNGVSITVNDTNINTSSGGFFNSLNTTQNDGFAYGNNGNNAYFTISSTIGADLFGIEFQYGNGIFSDALTLEWVALNNGTEVDSGTQQNAQRGSVYGISGSTAFDEVRLSAYRASDKSNCDNNPNCTSPIQFIALDNLRIDLDGPPNVATVPLPAGAGLLLTALGGLAAFRRFRKS